MNETEETGQYTFTGTNERQRAQRVARRRYCVTWSSPPDFTAQSSSRSSEIGLWPRPVPAVRCGSFPAVCPQHLVDQTRTWRGGAGRCRNVICGEMMKVCNSTIMLKFANAGTPHCCLACTDVLKFSANGINYLVYPNLQSHSHPHPHSHALTRLQGKGSACLLICRHLGYGRPGKGHINDNLKQVRVGTSDKVKRKNNDKSIKYMWWLRP